MKRTYEEINDKIQKKKVTVLTAGEFVALAKEEGVKAAAKKADVVTTATFGPMCSSGAILNFGHSDPPIRMGKITLNDVSAYGGLAAVDTYIGATQPSETKGMEYGGAHVIEDLIGGKSIRLKAQSYGTDCYPLTDIDTKISLADMNQAYLFNPRNVYQNYAAATNSQKKTLYTYMGILLPNMGNITYSTSGEYSPLLKDPELRTIGMGTRIFLGGGEGYVAWEGTQAVNTKQNYDDGEVRYAGYTLALIGDMKGMSTDYIRGATYEKYGCSLFVGVGIPIPVLDEDIAEKLAVSNEHLFTNVFDYGVGSRVRPAIRRVSYAELRGGEVELNGQKVPTAPLSSLVKAVEIANVLKGRIEAGTFTLTQGVPLPKHDVFKPLNVK